MILSMIHIIFYSRHEVSIEILSDQEEKVQSIFWMNYIWRKVEGKPEKYLWRKGSNGSKRKNILLPLTIWAIDRGRRKSSNLLEFKGYFWVKGIN